MFTVADPFLQKALNTTIDEWFNSMANPGFNIYNIK